MGFSRREFIALSAAGAAEVLTTRNAAAEVAGSLQSMVGVPYERKDPRIGIIGVGGRGTSLLKNLLAADGRVLAICDIAEDHAKNAQQLVEKAGGKSPELYTDGDFAFEKLVARNDLDLVMIATPWIWHARMAVAAMEHGKHVWFEVPGVRTLEECWQIVHTSEKTRRHCTMLENCCYGYNETLVLKLVQDGRFGELLWGEGAYLHDLREELFSNKGEGLWRRKEHTLRNGNLYPTHGLGPVANYMGIARGDNFEYLVSMSSPEAGFSAYRKEHVPAGDPKWKEVYKEGDFNISLIKTAKGRTITVKHDTSNPIPYSRINAIAGSKGVFEDYPPRIYFDGQEGGEKYTSLDDFKQYQSPLWEKMGEIGKKLGGHGGMDFLMLYSLLSCFREGVPPDMDVYDAALWASVVPLSIASVAQGSAPQKVPDFLRGRWKGRAETTLGSLKTTAS
ncbi:Gfo/Idh/MocA family protein [Edaphobacter albus]|uniref:Gfo/Idh/MocA family protein n=1 Tax=Edaphobacter sp. 4G125 TaxID=2763071 RepID=UPI001645F892|nr:Gfo/Idh/MocA family oxidoreductase [Edaphobacter sp. 4G125]QNI38121.1 Gfo/Idh/MocA family oxidoreductase [Edaphobacter sp. 4G125]